MVCHFFQVSNVVLTASSSLTLRVFPKTLSKALGGLQSIFAKGGSVQLFIFVGYLFIYTLHHFIENFIS